jgi:uncharacterized protein
MKKIHYLTFMFIILLSLTAFTANAEKGHMTLLTVGERGNETLGGTADVYLEVKPGSGRIFIDSFPLTKLDTQISTRFANEVACDFLNEDCSNKDFFYTIRAKSSVVGGPSAGAALTVLTISVLENLDLNESVVMTGTINSGGIIGPVAGIQEKVTAAKQEGFKKALIPKRSIISEVKSGTENGPLGNNSNTTIVYSDTLKIDGIEVVPISTLEDALYEFTGKKYPDYSYDMKIPEQYNDMMKNVSNNICERTKEIIQLIPSSVIENQSDKYNYSISFIERANNSFNQGDYYTAASYCFNANKELRDIEYSQYSKSELLLIAKDAEQMVNKMLDDVNKRHLNTMSDLETSIVMKERLLEAKDLLENNQTQMLQDLPYIVERIQSAQAWSAFFNYPGKKVVLDDAHLQQACQAKIAEAEERVNYLELLFGEYKEYRDEIASTKQIYDSGDYAFCLFKASRIKADTNAILTSLSITEEKFPELLDDQLKLAKIQINKQKDNFPILGYSYYNYAKSLKDTKPELSLIYSEYASEFSNLDMYFPRTKQSSFMIDRVQLGTFLIGFSVGLFFVVMLMFFIGLSKKNKNKNKIKLKKLRK